MIVNPTPRELTINRNGEPFKIFMSYGLLSRLTSIVKGPDGWGVVATDVDLQEAVLKEVFTVRDKKTGEVTSKVEFLDDLGVDLDDVEKIFDWAGAHILDFFTRRLVRSNDQILASQSQLQKSIPISTGS